VPVVLALRITNPAGTEACRYRTGYFEDTPYWFSRMAERNFQSALRLIVSGLGPEESAHRSVADPSNTVAHESHERARIKNRQTSALSARSAFKLP
jgi:hypothetical protein